MPLFCRRGWNMAPHELQSGTVQRMFNAFLRAVSVLSHAHDRMCNIPFATTPALMPGVPV